MDDIRTTTIGEFLAELGSSSPAPGGGSVAALSGAMGAALVSMLCNLTIGKAKYAEYEDFARETLAKSEAITHDLLDCLKDDMTAYNGVIAALRLPKDTDEQKSERSRALQEAYKSATSAPEHTINNCLEVMRLAKSLLGKSNPTAACDLAAAGIEAHAGIFIAMDSINANLAVIHDADYVARVKAWAENTEREAEKLLREIQEAVK